MDNQILIGYLLFCILLGSSITSEEEAIAWNPALRSKYILKNKNPLHLAQQKVHVMQAWVCECKLAVLLLTSMTVFD